MSWHYRRVNVKECPMYAIYEVYFENGRPVARTKDPVYPFGNTVKELDIDFNNYMRAFAWPVLDDLSVEVT